jgi:hypothetical protein
MAAQERRFSACPGNGGMFDIDTEYLALEQWTFKVSDVDKIIEKQTKSWS